MRLETLSTLPRGAAAVAAALLLAHSTPAAARAAAPPAALPVDVEALCAAVDPFAREVPGLFFFLGGKPLDVAAEDAAPHHTPDFFVDEAGMRLGVRALTRLTLDYMAQEAGRQAAR